MRRLSLLIGIARANGAVTLIASADRPGKLDSARATAVAAVDTYKEVGVVEEVVLNSTSKIVNPPAVNSVAPAITGTAQVGQTLTTTNGTWSHSPSFTRQWKAAGVAISGATGTTYVPVIGDIGKVITCLVTAKTAGGRVSQVSNSTAAVIAA